MSIKKKLIKGGIWNFLSQSGAQIINFLITIILARLLLPEDFGLIGKIMVITGFLGYFTEFGLAPSLILKKDSDELDYNTVFWGSISLSLIAYLVVYLSSPLIASFYEDSRLIFITRILFLDFLFKPLAFIPTVLENKKLQYNTIAISNLLSILSAGIIATTLAIGGFGIWALVTQQIALSLFLGIYLTIFVRWKPQLIFSYKRLLSHLKKGIHFTINNLVKFFSENIDFLLVGKFAGDYSLGIYTFAFRMSRYPIAKLWNIFGKMLFPAFTTMNEDITRLSKNFLKVNIVFVYFIAPILVFTFFEIESLLLLLVGQKWLPSVPIVRVILFYIFFETFGMVDTPILMSLELIKLLNTVRAIASFSILIIGYYALINHGALGIAFVYTIIFIIHFVVIKMILLKKIGMKIRTFISAFRELFMFISLSILSFKIFSCIPISPINKPIIYLFCGILLLFFNFLAVILWKGIVDFKKRSLNLDRLLPKNFQV